QFAFGLIEDYAADFTAPDAVPGQAPHTAHEPLLTGVRPGREPWPPLTYPTPPPAHVRVPRVEAYAPPLRAPPPAPPVRRSPPPNPPPCPTACTPVSVRAAPVAVVRRPIRRASTASNSACTVRPSRCRCHPTNWAPS